MILGCGARISGRTRYVDGLAEANAVTTYRTSWIVNRTVGTDAACAAERMRAGVTSGGRRARVASGCVANGTAVSAS